MNKKSLLILSLFFSICLILFACRKDLNNFVKDQEIRSIDLESAKIFYAKATQIPTGQAKLKPLWGDAWSVQAKNGSSYIVVPTVEKRISNKSLDIRRVFIFPVSKNEVNSGKITEFIGQNYDVTDHLNELISKSEDAIIPAFNGSILNYNLNYMYISGNQYVDGNKTNSSSKIVNKPNQILAIKNKISLSKSMGVGANGRRDVSSIWNYYQFNENCDYFIILNNYYEITNIIEFNCFDPSTGDGSNGDGTNYGDGSTSGQGTTPNDIPHYGGVEFAMYYAKKPAINLQHMLNCFNQVSNINATYSMTINTDIPNNWNADDTIVGTDGGHASITLTKTAGGKSVTKTFGFYPNTGDQGSWLAVTQALPSKIGDNSSMQVNASLTTKNMTSVEFGAAMTKAVQLTSENYHLSEYNCTNFAVDVFKAGASSVYLNVNQSEIIPGLSSLTPCGLYKAIATKKAQNDSDSTPWVAAQAHPGNAPVGNKGVCPPQQ